MSWGTGKKLGEAVDPFSELAEAYRTGDYSVLPGLSEREPEAVFGRQLDGRTGFGHASFAGALATVEELLKTAPPEAIVARDAMGSTPLHDAVVCGHGDIVVLFLELLPSRLRCAKDRSGRTALHLVAESGSLGMTTLLSEYLTDADFSHRGPHGWTALHCASYRGHTAVVRLFLSRMSDSAVQAMNGDGFTALHRACGAGHTEIVDILIQRSSQAALMQRTLSGYTGLRLAAQGCHLAVLRLLFDVIESHRITTELGGAILRSACQVGVADVIELLVKHLPPGSVSALDSSGNNAFHVAAVWESLEAINVMLDHATPGDLAKTNTNGAIPADLIADHLPSVAAGMRPLSKSAVL